MNGLAGILTGFYWILTHFRLYRVDLGRNGFLPSFQRVPSQRAARRWKTARCSLSDIWRRIRNAREEAFVKGCPS